MVSLPLVSHTSPDSLIVWRAEGRVTLQQFLSDVRQLAALFPAAGHLLNLCSDRYRFSVGLAAAIVSGKISLLPPAHTSETVRQIQRFAPEVFCLTDDDACGVELPQLCYPLMADNPAGAEDSPAIPQIDVDQLIAIVFTSGSTGTPQPHPKTWGALVRSVQAESARLGIQDTACTLVGTVPPQHMYGFESTVLMAWQSGNALSHAQPFYPADICHALTAVPLPRILVSSPIHLRTLLDAQVALPTLTGVVSATAPLSAQLARDIETRCEAPLMEIYGSTETGLIATRRPAHSAQWQLLPDVKLFSEGDSILAGGGHVSIPTALSDSIEPLSDTHFLLHGRIADLVNIAGKRHSLASLNHVLTTVPGVVDGVFYMPDEPGNAHVTRLAACVVAPGLDAPGLLAALRKHLDPVFLPRPLLFVEALPRNRVGKLPRAALHALFEARAKQTA